jgi:hypothetical protein
LAQSKWAEKYNEAKDTNRWVVIGLEIIQKLSSAGQGFRKVMSSCQIAQAVLLHHSWRETKFNDHHRITVCLRLFW